ncbi:PilW family protein [Tahibacter amnicola]|uniref:PilW family protein n=1 Tax=Tahibacter amnicola TaxID=2976241 RepID=A0ABY6BH45_9GAMM|nr:PilW family protein [Tahibacter amnicola]UXI67182.1 PilW family protein [Tahibacter amnicola]
MKKATHPIFQKCSSAAARQQGLSLIELMVALALGVLITFGLIGLFTTTSRTNRVQEALARLQENGRFATMRLTDEFRSSMGQFCNATSGQSTKSSNGVVSPARAPMVWSKFQPDEQFADAPGATLIPSEPLGWRDPDGPYPLSPRYFLQGYDCTTGCTPNLPASVDLPNKVPGTDVLTVRSLSGTGWRGVCSLVDGAPQWTIEEHPDGGDSKINFENGDFAYVTDCNSPTIMKMTFDGGTVLKADPAALLDGTPSCPANGGPGTDTRVFNATKDLRTVTYFLATKPDPSPDSPGGSVISSLYRRVNGGAPVELVEGVERLDFLYGVQDLNGAVRYLTAAEVEANSGPTTCSPPPADLTDAAKKWLYEPGCLWRSVKSIEAHMLVNTVKNQFDLADVDKAYRYSVGDPYFALEPTAPTDPMPVTNLPAGSKLRREFIATISVRATSL